MQYTVTYLPKGSKVYIHTDHFGKNQLIAGKVLCTFMEMKPGHACCTFVKTGLGIVKIASSPCCIYENLTTSLDNYSYRKSCGVFASVEDFRAGNKIEWCSADAHVDVYGLKQTDLSSRQYGELTVHAYYLKGSSVESSKYTVYHFLHDEDNGRLVPSRSLYDTAKQTEGVIEQLLATPMTKQELLLKIGERHSDVLFETREAAEKSLTDNVEVVDLDGEVFREEPKQPTLKDKLKEFADQQGTSLEMLLTIINEIPEV